MATLKFKGPFHFDHIYDSKRGNRENCGEINSLFPPNKPGIYIWGFIMRYDSAKNELGDSVDFNDKNNFIEYACNGNEPIGVNLPNDWKFIPYYVGLDANLLDRVITHHSIRNGDSSKYIRMTENYYKSFFNDPCFIPNTGNYGGKRCREITTLIWPNGNIDSNKIVYQNCSCILNKLYGLNISKKIKSNGHENYNYPITDYNIEDTLYKIVNGNNNFWFCFAELDPADVSLYQREKKRNPKTNFLEYPEAQTFFSLKGKTISKTRRNYKPNKFHVNYKIDAESTCMAIFKQDPIGNIVDNTNFPGY